MFSRKQETPVINFNITIGNVEQPTADEYKDLRSNPVIHKIFLKIIDYRIANTYKSLGDGKLSNDDLQSLNGSLRALITLREIVK